MFNLRATVVLLMLGSALQVHGLKSANCTFQRQTVAAPVFGPGDNLSHESCGYWNPGENANAPWRVAIRGPSSTTHCFGTLISPTTVFSWACSASAHEFTTGKNKAEWSAHVGKCHDPKESLATCSNGGAGQKLQVEAVTELQIPNLYTLNVWKIKAVRLEKNKFSPICLFNKDNSKDFVGTDTYAGFKWKPPARNSSATMVQELRSCLNENMYDLECARLKHNICVRYSSTALHPYLVHVKGDKYFLRGIEDYRGKDYNHEIFTDLLPHLKEIVAKSTGITLNKK